MSKKEFETALIGLFASKISLSLTSDPYFKTLTNHLVSHFCVSLDKKYIVRLLEEHADKLQYEIVQKLTNKYYCLKID